ncbi:hypothetical protein R3I94_004442 [Phoxinus phoxinus]
MSEDTQVYPMRKYFINTD